MTSRELQSDFHDVIETWRKELPGHQEYLAHIHEQIEVYKENPFDEYAGYLFSPVFPNSLNYLQQMAMIGRLEEAERNLRVLFKNYIEAFKNVT